MMQKVNKVIRYLSYNMYEPTLRTESILCIKNKEQRALVLPPISRASKIALEQWLNQEMSTPRNLIYRYNFSF